MYPGYYVDNPQPTNTNPLYYIAPRDLANCFSQSPYVQAYPWTPSKWSSPGGFGVKYSNPLTLPGVFGYGVAFCGSTDIATVSGFTPYVAAYPWTPKVGFGVKYANPATLPFYVGDGVAFCGSTDIAVADSSNPNVSAYPWTPGIGFGVRYNDPIIVAAGYGLKVSFRI